MSRQAPSPARRKATRGVASRVGGMTPRRENGSGGNDISAQWLRSAGGYSWRILVVGAIVYILAVVAGMLQFVFVALFGAIVMTAVLRPMVDFLSKILPRWLALIIAFIGATLTVLEIGSASCRDREAFEVGTGSVSKK